MLANNLLHELQKSLEEKYPQHDFKWKESSYGHSRLTGLCPQHNDTNPSFNIFMYKGKNGKDYAYYKCFSCDYHGGLIEFIQNKLTPEEAEKNIRRKDAQTRLWKAFYDMRNYLLNGNTVETAIALKYLDTRGTGINVLKTSETGFIETGRDYGIDDLLAIMGNGKPNKIEYYAGYIVFAYTNIMGDICEFKFREPDSKIIKTAKIEGFENEVSAFGLKRIGNGAEENYPVPPHIYITEGEFNYFTYRTKTGIANVIAAGSKNNITLELAGAISSIGFYPIVALDQDPAGGERLKKLYEKAKEKDKNNILYCEYNKKDFDDLLKDKKDNAIAVAIGNIRHYFLSHYQATLEIENLKKEAQIEKFVNEAIKSPSLKEIYLEKNKVVSTLSQRLYNIPDDITDSVLDESIFGVKIQFPAMFTIVGSTSAGKTEFALEIADEAAKIPGHISMFYQYEGNEIDLKIRAKRKGIDNPNFYFKTAPTLETIEKDTLRFKDKKMFIIIDYYQLMARFLQTNDKGKTDSLRPYMSKIFFTFLDLIKKNKNICVCFLSSLSNQAFKELPTTQAGEINNIVALSGIKEDGDIGYNMDYAYIVAFGSKDEIMQNKCSISRINRDYIVLKPIKAARIGTLVDMSYYKFVINGRDDAGNQISYRYVQDNSFNEAPDYV